jgi:uncharacterized protein (TIGR02466 family)
MAKSALLAAQAGRHEDAADLARRALSAEPHNPNVLHALGELAWGYGDASSAANLLAQAVAGRHETPPPEWQRLLAHALVRGGRLDEGSRVFRASLDAAPGDTATWLALARSLYGIGDMRGATGAFERAIALDPNDWWAHHDLGSTLMETRDWEGAERAFEEADRLHPGEATFAVSRATLEMRQGRVGPAIESLQAAVRQHPDYAAAHAGLGFALREARRYEEAAGPLRRAMALAPGNSSYGCALGRVLLEGGRAEEALAQALIVLEKHPGYAGGRTLEALSRIAVGDAAGVATLLDYERLVRRAPIATPAGFSDLAQFNAALSAHARNHPTLIASPSSNATRDGFHSGSLLAEPMGPVTGLVRAVEEAASAYWRERSGQPDHHFLGVHPESVVLKMWTVVLQAGGRQIAHTHPLAWLSGVYYPQLTDSIRSGSSRGGWLEFGEPDHAFPARMSAPIVGVRPEEGLLVLFPSYMYHRTIPFEGDGTRISVAFDLVPAKRSA